MTTKKDTLDFAIEIMNDYFVQGEQIRALSRKYPYRESDIAVRLREWRDSGHFMIIDAVAERSDIAGIRAAKTPWLKLASDRYILEIMNRRMKGERNSELAADYGVSSRTISKWLQQYRRDNKDSHRFQVRYEENEVDQADVESIDVQSAFAASVTKIFGDLIMEIREAKSLSRNQIQSSVQLVSAVESTILLLETSEESPVELFADVIAALRELRQSAPKIVWEKMSAVLRHPALTTTLGVGIGVLLDRAASSI